MKAAVMVMVTLGLGAGACTGEPDGPPTVNAGEIAEAEEPTKAEPPGNTDEAAKDDAAVAGTPDELAKVEPAAVAEADEPAPVTEPAPTAEPAPAAAMPTVVSAALVKKKRWVADMTDFTGMSVRELQRKLERALETRGEDAARRELKDGDPLMPGGFAVGDPWTIVTRTGVEHHTAEGFVAKVSAGSGTLHLDVRLGPVTGKPKGPAVALRGDLPLTTPLAVPEPLAASEIDASLRKRIDRALTRPIARDLKDESEALRKLVLAIPIRAKDVEAYPGRFPGDRTHVLFVQTGPASPDTGMAISGVLFMKPDGTVEFHRLADEWGSVSLLGLLDVNGDGFDEVFYEDQYHEGWSLVMLHWDGDVPRSRTLSGDGL